MNDKIEPALTPEEWRDALDPDVREGLAYEKGYLWGRDRPHGAIAILNAALPDSDPRKITHGKLEYIREVARTQSAAMARIGEDLVAQRMNGFADALESYLPPET